MAYRRFSYSNWYVYPTDWGLEIHYKDDSRLLIQEKPEVKDIFEDCTGFVEYLSAHFTQADMRDILDLFGAILDWVLDEEV